jgi:hypothetical protein
MQMMRWWRRRPAISFAILLAVWILILQRQYALVQKIDANIAGTGPTTPTQLSQSSGHGLAQLTHPDQRVKASFASIKETHSPSPAVKRAPSESIEKVVKEQKPKASVQKELTMSNRQGTGQHDGTFNNVPITYRKGAPSSAAHCVGGDSRPANVSWMFRSCQFQNLCMDLKTRDYVLVRDNNAKSNHEHEGWLPPQAQVDKHFTDYAVSLGGINSRWSVGRGFNKGVWKVKWFPRIIDASDVQAQGYYELPPDRVLVPFHSFAAHNVGHLLWDDFYPIFSLMRLFGFGQGAGESESESMPLSQKKKLLLVRQQVNGTLYASCDIRPNKRKKCKENFAKFLPLMGVDPAFFSTSKDVRLQLQPPASGADQPFKSQYICARTAAAGLGMLTDHGLRDHGWIEHNGTELEWVPHNLGRGAGFAQFRDFMINNFMGEQQAQAQAVAVVPAPDALPRVSFSILSSRDWDRRLNFTLQIDYLRAVLPAEKVHIEASTLWESSMREQIQIAQQSNIFVSTCGGSSMTATFLPRGASLILFYNPVGGFDFADSERTGQARRNGRAARLDWDLMNHASHLRVHWLPITSMDSDDDLELLLRLVQHELSIIKRQSEMS